MRILYTTTIGGTMTFFKSLIKELVEDGHTVDIATNETDSKVPDVYRELGCAIYPISWSRSPFSKGNITAINELKEVVKNGNYDIVHCHTPICAAITRIACKNFRKNGLKVVYTAHGFHFYKGAPFKNWMIYYPIEKICAHWTDVLITINKEDYELAKNKMKAKRVGYVLGVGIDTKKFADVVVERDKKREEIGVPEDAFLILSVGELNKNKNHQVILRAISELRDKNIHYAIAGKGDQEEELKNLAKELGIDQQFHLLGYRNDVPELYKIGDVYALPSIREGLNVSVMEALAAGLPCIVGKIRGNVDLVQDGENGYYINPFDMNTAVESIKIAANEGKKENVATTAEKFDGVEINMKMLDIYRKSIE